MFDKRWRIGTLLGFPVEINLTFLLLLGVVLIWFGGLAGLFVVGIAFGSVLLHELGHAVVARRLGVRVSGIELHFFGGAAKMIELPRSANHEIAIAAAGPAVSLVLAGLGLGLGAMTGVWLLAVVGWINLTIALFNLIPALPMDGGRILRAALTRKMDFVRATDVSVTIARGFAIALAAFGLYAGAYQLLLLAPFLWVLGTREKQMARQMAHRYAYDGDGYVERRAPAYDDGYPHGSDWGGAPRRIVIRQRDGRFVIELV
jgi:Zn-dependent protease